MEYYSPEALTTKNGSLKITLSAKPQHGLNYTGGLMSTWNKFCFTGGMILASVTLPGVNNVVGLWPALWTMGNLGRAGYGASLEGMWPYTYDACDIGTVANQSINGLPEAAVTGGDSGQNGILSFLPGQRLSRCSCPNSPHPGPMHADGTYVGRSAPEIDIFEAQITGTPLSGQVSQSGQWGVSFGVGFLVWTNADQRL
jgi:beta-glucanase (GH16 family)